MDVYDVYEEKMKKSLKVKIGIGIAAVVIIIALIAAAAIYLDIIQLNEIGKSFFLFI
jgi:hypothetical protein